MPKKIDPELRARAVRPVAGHRDQYSSVTKASIAVARQLGVSRESARRWSPMPRSMPVRRRCEAGVSSDEHEEIKRLRSENRRLREDVAILKSATTFFAGDSTPATADHRVRRHHEGPGPRGLCRSAASCASRACRSAAQTYRSWRTTIARQREPSPMLRRRWAWVRDIGWQPDPKTGEFKLAAEGLYGRRKMVAHVRRMTLPGASAGAVDRAMTALGLTGVRRGKGTRTTIPSKDGKRAGDLLGRAFTADAANLVWGPTSPPPDHRTGTHPRWDTRAPLSCPEAPPPPTAARLASHQHLP